MPAGEILVLLVIVDAFIAFAGTLGWYSRE
jgi:hypothetical protein